MATTYKAEHPLYSHDFVCYPFDENMRPILVSIKDKYGTIEPIDASRFQIEGKLVLYQVDPDEQMKNFIERGVKSESSNETLAVKRVEYKGKVEVGTAEFSYERRGFMDFLRNLFGMEPVNKIESLDIIFKSRTE